MNHGKAKPSAGPLLLTRRQWLCTGVGAVAAFSPVLYALRRFLMAPAPRLPVVFLGHGNPMNGIADNAFTQTLARLGNDLPRPKAVLCVSAHWMTPGSTWVTHMAQPKTIHDFGGFPQALFDVQYPAPGSPQLADLVRSEVPAPKVQADDEAWGLDHGAWTVLKHMYPAADVPVLQLSIDMSQPPEFHFQLGRELRALREKGLLVVGSGNIVHNLRVIDFAATAKPFDWALEFDAWVKERLEKRDFASLVKDARASQAGKLSIPTTDHWFPLLYTLGAADEKDDLRFVYEGVENASISMRCLTLG